MELPEPILAALDGNCGQPLRLIDPRTKREYLLVPADLFERIQYAEDEGLDSRQVAALIAQTMREEDEGDPALESYQQQYGKAE